MPIELLFRPLLNYYYSLIESTYCSRVRSCACVPLFFRIMSAAEISVYTMLTLSWSMWPSFAVSIIVNVFCTRFLTICGGTIGYMGCYGKGDSNG